MLDFAVNVRADAPPAWLADRLRVRMGDLGRYPGADDVARATSAVALRHGRDVAEVEPSFTDPEAALAEAVRPEWPVLLDAIVEAMR
jgi:histidinol-phosphate/aromatic aminotransferase/cobyric acid decarboxylase-like protein